MSSRCHEDEYLLTQIGNISPGLS